MVHNQMFGFIIISAKEVVNLFLEIFELSHSGEPIILLSVNGTGVMKRKNLILGYCWKTAYIQEIQIAHTSI